MESFKVFFELIARVLAFYYELVPSFGFAIIALTLTVMVILTPLTLKGTRSMMMMQQLQPEMKKLQERHKALEGSHREAAAELDELRLRVEEQKASKSDAKAGASVVELEGRVRALSTERDALAKTVDQLRTGKSGVFSCFHFCMKTFC